MCAQNLKSVPPITARHSHCTARHCTTCHCITCHCTALLFNVRTKLKDVPIHSMKLLRHLSLNCHQPYMDLQTYMDLKDLFATAPPTLLHVPTELKDVPIHNMKLLQRMSALEEQGTKFGVTQLQALHSLGERGRDEPTLV